MVRHVTLKMKALRSFATPVTDTASHPTEVHLDNEYSDGFQTKSANGAGATNLPAV